jgi:uncharacterized protein YjbI with pentapeptide repeats
MRIAMTVDTELQKAITGFRKRWDLDLINLIVVRLNRGIEIESLLKKAFGECCKNDSSKSDLRGIDLSHQNLRGPWSTVEGQRKRMGINLENSDLTGANLNWAILPKANLRRCCMKYVNLRDAELIMADLSGSDLVGADFTGAWLLNTRLTEASVSESQLKMRRFLGQLDFEYHAYDI